VLPFWRSICEFANGARIGVLVTVRPSPSITKVGPTAELGVVVMNQELRLDPQLAQLPGNVSGLLSHPLGVRRFGHPEPITRLVASSI
jgi:hypothetical protein